MILLKDLLTENREGGVFLTHKGEEKWFPAHTEKTIKLQMRGDKVALYPKLMDNIIKVIHNCRIDIHQPNRNVLYVIIVS